MVCFYEFFCHCVKASNALAQALNLAARPFNALASHGVGERMDSKASRKKIVVKPVFQLKTALTLTIYLIIYSLILGFFIFYPLYIELNSVVSPEAHARVSSIIHHLHKRVWVGLFIVAVLAGIHTILASHRVAGPMYRFEKMVDDLIWGRYSRRIRIRKGDEFREMEGLLNTLAETLDISRARDGQFYVDVKTRLETISAMLEAEGAAYPEDVRRLMQTLISELAYRERPAERTES